MSRRIEEVRNVLVELGWTANPNSVSFLAEGEYHENWRFTFITSGSEEIDAVFRINHGSQLGLEDQIAYEYRVLEAVKPSGRTPVPLGLATNHDGLENGALAMGFIDGRPLEYCKDSKAAASTLAKIHTSAHIFDSMIHQAAPLSAVAAECRTLLSRTKTFPAGSRRRLYAEAKELDRLQRCTEAPGRGPLTVCNTELNSGNWIISAEGCYLLDWEKAVVSDPVQDLAHFVSPTTTLWKTDFRFDTDSREAFIDAYRDAVNASVHWSLDELIVRTGLMERAVRLRAISWCLMAFEEYEIGGRDIVNEDTREKLQWYHDSWEELLCGT